MIALLYFNLTVNILMYLVSLNSWATGGALYESHFPLKLSIGSKERQRWELGSLNRSK